MSGTTNKWSEEWDFAADTEALDTDVIDMTDAVAHDLNHLERASKQVARDNADRSRRGKTKPLDLRPESEWEPVGAGRFNWDEFWRILPFVEEHLQNWAKRLQTRGMVSPKETRDWGGKFTQELTYDPFARLTQEGA